ncbi:MAG: hypothetical protein M8357_08820 [Desulfobulbaceae bacterium]|nr:hypothetical protein [Desulfobulbaceae bacterium]
MKVLITISGKNIAPRFDLVTEVLVANIDQEKKTATRVRTILLPRPSAEELCSLILKENISTVICGGIEDTYYKYLSWKNVKIIDSVIGPFTEALRHIQNNSLASWAILTGAATETESL